MGEYVAIRALMAVPVVLFISVLVFLMVEAMPGDAVGLLAGEDATFEDVEAMRHQLGLDRPLVVRYGDFFWKALHGDMGRSLIYKIPVRELIGERVVATAQLGLTALVIAVVLGVSLGVVAALMHKSLLDNVATVLAIVGISMPVFWLGLLMMWAFSVELGWLPTSGKGGLTHLVLPAVTLSGVSTPMIMRMTRSSMLEVLRQDYIRTASAKGLRYAVVVNRHALRNALIPVITVIMLQLGFMLSGSVLTETVFNWPGLGRLVVEGIKSADIPIVQWSLMVIAVGFVCMYVIMDILYAFVDPRIRHA
jgi:ABC-type dipeptide/oligopeptide/nickel transport system permease component